MTFFIKYDKIKKVATYIQSGGAHMKKILNLKNFCDKKSGKVNFTPTFDNNGLPKEIQVKFNSNSTLNAVDWWNVKTLLQKDQIILVYSDYDAFKEGTILCIIYSKNQQYKLHKLIYNLQQASDYLSSLASM